MPAQEVAIGDLFIEEEDSGTWDYSPKINRLHKKLATHGAYLYFILYIIRVAKVKILFSLGGKAERVIIIIITVSPSLSLPKFGLLGLCFNGLDCCFS